MTSTIALLTDFGTKDVYVGAMKGVILGIAPQAQLIDLTHHIEAQNVRQAAFLLMGTFRYFPKGTIFLVVVDPGVGSTRKPIAAQAGDYAFIAPDNGVLTYALADYNHVHAVELTNPQYRLSDVSLTFHGRDVFAPAAAHLAAGVEFDNLGDPLTEIFHLPMPELIVGEKRVRGEIMNIDRFGNIITSIGQMRWLSPERLTLEPRFGERRAPVPVRGRESAVKIHGTEISGISHAYSDTHRGNFLALVGSNGYLEIAVNQGNAAKMLDVVIGDHLDLILGE